MVVRRGRGRGGAQLVFSLSPLDSGRFLLSPSGSVEGAEVPLQVFGLVVVGEKVVLVDVVLVVVLMPLRHVFFVVLVVLILCLLAALLTRVVVVVRVSGVRRSVRLRPGNKVRNIVLT